MPIKDNARKALRQAKKRTESNKAVANRIQFLKKQTLKAISKKEESAGETIKKFVQAVDKAAKNHIIKKNTASRMKSRLMKKWNAAMKK